MDFYAIQSVAQVFILLAAVYARPIAQVAWQTMVPCAERIRTQQGWEQYPYHAILVARYGGFFATRNVAMDFVHLVAAYAAHRSLIVGR